MWDYTGAHRPHQTHTFKATNPSQPSCNQLQFRLLPKSRYQRGIFCRHAFPDCSRSLSPSGDNSPPKRPAGRGGANSTCYVDSTWIPHALVDNVQTGLRAQQERNQIGYACFRPTFGPFTRCRSVHIGQLYTACRWGEPCSARVHAASEVVRAANTHFPLTNAGYTLLCDIPMRVILYRREPLFKSSGSCLDIRNRRRPPDMRTSQTRHSETQQSDLLRFSK